MFVRLRADYFEIRSFVIVASTLLKASAVWFAWLMIWRWMPTALRTRWPGLLLLAIGATLAALAFEIAWYGLVNNVDPLRILAADTDPDLAPRPTLKVLLAGLAVIVLAGLQHLASFVKRRWTERYIRGTIPTS